MSDSSAAEVPAEQPLRKVNNVFLIQGGLKNKNGTLLLYPSKIVHVARSNFAMAFGLIGALIASLAGGGKAEAWAAKGGKGVTTVPLASVSGITKSKQGLNKNILEVHTADGSTLRFGAKYDQWATDISQAVTATGRSATPSEDGISFG